ncbi:hypothetical protein PISMIDRAFT_679559 [Pisolithus microcarpus 441]|uniref:Uncharacterized protein n=1 Tax=Pisolithus microcarpus 441 TaxID=765257 RepID=A0A0C9Z2L6_9AGAM|nr:hypothetical protein PISMIDRAFT_679559 [Pisolithus microcarpus 441]
MYTATDTVRTQRHCMYTPLGTSFWHLNCRIYPMLNQWKPIGYVVEDASRFFRPTGGSRVY